MFSRKSMSLIAVLGLLIFSVYAAAGPNANGILSLDLIADGGAGNRTDDGITSGTVSGRGTTIAIEIFATGVRTSLIDMAVKFDFDSSLLSFVKAENSAFPLTLPEGSTGTRFAPETRNPVALASSGFLARAEFTTVSDVTGTEFSIGIESVTLSEGTTSSDELITTSVITFNATPSPDFDGDNWVGFPDFLIFAQAFGSRQGDGTYDARIDLNSDGSIGFTDFLIFAQSFGSAPPSTGGGSPDLVVQSPSVSDNNVASGATFTLSATVRNEGDGSSAATTLHYYRSTDATVSTSDTEVGTDAVRGLAAGRASAESIDLAAPSDAGTYYYGACVDAVTGESDTGNNCSAAVSITVAAVTPPGAGGVNRMYWTDVSTSKIQRSNLDGSGVEDLVTTGLEGPVGIALDVSGGKMYWTDGSSKIQRSNLDGSGVEDLVTTGLEGPGGIALDVSGGKMYWTDASTVKIQRSNLDGSDVEDLVTTGLEIPGGIALDVSGGKMYWTDGELRTAKIQRSNLDGSGVEDLVTTGLESSVGIALDVSGGKMYWTDASTEKIQRSNLDGSGVEDLVTGLVDPFGIALDVSGGKMYWTEVGADRIQRSNLDGSGVEDLVTTGLVDPFGIALSFGLPVEVGTDLAVRASVSDNTLTPGQSFTLSVTVSNHGTEQAAATTLRYYRSTDATISTQDTEVGTGPVDALAAAGTSAESIRLTAPSSEGTYHYGACVATVAGEADTRNNCSTAVTITVAAEAPPATGASKLYWTDASTEKIQRSNLDGSGVEDLVVTGLLPAGIALDVSGGKMYWTDVRKIQRSNLDGSGVEDLVTGLRNPNGIALDVSGGKMYWTNLGSDKIQRSNLDGSGVEDLVTGLEFPKGIALDVSGGKMYWTDHHTDKIQRSNLDGSGVEDLVTSDDGLEAPLYIALDVSGGKMYWTDSLTQKIHRSNLDGSGVEDLVVTGLLPAGIALDVSGGKMYWTDVRKIQRSNLDGSGVEDLVTGLERPQHIALGFGVPVEAGTDLGVLASVSDNILTPGQSFTLSATVRNWGTEPASATTLRYYRSDDATIDNIDTEVGTDAVRGLAAGGASDQSISLTAPSSAGASYYGACVESVSGERNTGNNCSSGVRVSHVPSPIVRIPDANLRAVIEAALGTASGAPITVRKMETLRSLTANYAGISDLTGLEFATYLTEISLVANNITDVSPLSGLTYLNSLQLAGNNITDQSVLASCLRSLTNLELLTLGGTGFADISALSGLTNLTLLDLKLNGISDISPLSGLTNLELLWLEHNNITDISPLGGLTNLTSIVLLNNNITDLSPLSGLTNLEWLHLNGNNITESDISLLSGLTNLSVLELSSSNITDLSSLSGLTNLTDLRLRDSNITDLSPLSGLTNLSVLNLSFSNITDISSLVGLTNLTELDLSFSNITDISSLVGLTNLTELDLSFSNITDISSLVGLTNLRDLDIRGNLLSDSSITEHVPALESRGVTVRFEAFRKGDFDIELVFLDPFTEVQKRVLQYAARRWMSVITEDLPEYEFTRGWSGTCGDQSFEIPSGERIDDLRIYVTSFDDIPGAVGWGAPDLLREATYLPVLGCMGFDLERANLLITGLHEMGHVLGFGTVWDELGFYQNPPDGDRHFNGPLAIAAFDDAGGWDYKGKKVPLNDSAHWRRSAFWSSRFPESPGELMMPGGGGALSAITVQSFADLGYGVDVTQADPYTLPGTTSGAKVAVATPAVPRLDVNAVRPNIHPPPGTDPYGHERVAGGLLSGILGDDGKTGGLESGERFWGFDIDFDVADARQMGHLGRQAVAEPELKCGVGLLNEPIYVVDQQGRVVRTIER